MFNEKSNSFYASYLELNDFINHKRNPLRNEQPIYVADGLRKMALKKLWSDSVFLLAERSPTLSEPAGT